MSFAHLFKECSSATDQKSYEADIVIVGAGLSGLTTAYRLITHLTSHASSTMTVPRILILEANDRVGGRLWTKHLPQDRVIDMGGAWVGPKCQPRICALLKELGIGLYSATKTQNGDSTVKMLVDVLVDDSDGSIFEVPASFDSAKASLKDWLQYGWMWAKFIFGFGIWSILDLALAMKRMSKSAASLATHFNVKAKRGSSALPGLHSNARDWDQMSIHAFCSQYMSSARARRVLASSLRTLTCGSTLDMSYYLQLKAIAYAGGVGPLMDDAQECVIEGGSGRVIEELCRKLSENPNVSALSRAVVCGIQLNDASTADQHSVLLRLLNGSVVKCGRVVIACPPTAYRRIHISPPLPTAHQTFINAIQMGQVIKVNVVYKDRFWRKPNVAKTGMIIYANSINAQTEPRRDLNGRCGLISAIVDGSNSTTSTLVVIISSDAATQFSLLSPITQRSQVLDELNHHFGDAAMNPEHFEVCEWSQNTFVMGGYQTVIPPGWATRTYTDEKTGENIQSMDMLLGELYDSRMMFCGSDVSLEWDGYMEGAVLTAERVAERILDLMLKQ